MTHLPGGQYQSAPLYDVLSAHPIIGRGRNQIAAQRARLAMAVRSKHAHYLMGEIERRHWIAQGRRVGLPEQDVNAMIDALTARTTSVIEEVSDTLPRDFPMDIADAVFNGMLRHNRKLSS